MGLSHLPPPPLHKQGWPWNVASPTGSAPTSPKISIITPSYNQGHFLEETIRSVLLQGYPNLEYIVIDGGSSDNSVEILQTYSDHLTYWVSEPDRGQSHAINKGLARATGDYIAWMNSDDCYLAGALTRVFQTDPQVDFIYGPTQMGADLNHYQVIEGRGIRKFTLANLLNFFYSIDYIIPSQSVFVSRALFEQVGYLNEELHYCMDLEWFIRMALRFPQVQRNSQPICFYRIHDQTKTGTGYYSMQREAQSLAQRYGEYLSASEQAALKRLLAFSNCLEEYMNGGKPWQRASLVATAQQFPREALRDRRFLGMLRRSLFK